MSTLIVQFLSLHCIVVVAFALRRNLPMEYMHNEFNSKEWVDKKRPVQAPNLDRVIADQVADICIKSSQADDCLWTTAIFNGRTQTYHSLTGQRPSRTWLYRTYGNRFSARDEKAKTIEADGWEDPRMISLGNKSVLIVQKGGEPVHIQAIPSLHMSSEDFAIGRFQPVTIKYRGEARKVPAKNYVPFVHHDRLHIVTAFDPLTILKCDKDSVATCYVYFLQDNNNAWEQPGLSMLKAKSLILRGGSDLFWVDDTHLVGFAHSRVLKTEQQCHHGTHLVVLKHDDVQPMWSLVHVSEPIVFQNAAGEMPDWARGACIVDPTSIASMDMQKDELILLLNVDDVRSVSVSVKGIRQAIAEKRFILDSNDTKKIGQWEELVSRYVLESSQYHACGTK